MKHMLMPHKEYFFSVVAIFCVHGYSVALCGAKECPQMDPWGGQQLFLHCIYFVLIFCVQRGREGGGTRSEYLAPVHLWCRYCTILILLLPRILSCDKNLACTKNVSACFGLIFTIARFCSSRVFFGAPEHDPILSADMLFRTPPNLELTYFEAPYRFANKDRSLLRASTD